MSMHFQRKVLLQWEVSTVLLDPAGPLGHPFARGERLQAALPVMSVAGSLRSQWIDPVLHPGRASRALRVVGR